MGKSARLWDHHWRENRQGPNLVKRNPDIEALLQRLKVQWSRSTVGCFYDPQSDRVNIPPKRTFIDANGQSATSAYYVVAFHEVVHWTAKRVGRPVGAAWFGSEEYAQEELVAELGPVMLMEHFGLELGAPQRHAFYFQCWLDRAGNEREEILKR